MKFTSQLIKLLSKEASPESVVKFIYLHVYELIKGSINFRKSDKSKYLFIKLSKVYRIYYKTVINPSSELWVKTIFPPYINGYKNFYRGIAGRLAFFSVDIDRIKEELENPTIPIALLVSDIPDTYYWYGNPHNWSYCYEIKLNEKKEIVIRKRQIFVLEDEDAVYEAMVDEKEVENNIHEILLLYKVDNNRSDVEDQPDSFPTRTTHISPYTIYDLRLENFTDDIVATIKESNGNVDTSIDKMMENYKANVSIKNGYNTEIQKIWDEYNSINFYSGYQRFPPYMTHKTMGEEEICELEEKFISEYKEKIKRLKEKNKNC